MRHLFFLKDPSLLVEQLAEEPAGESVKLAAAPEWVNILPEPDKDGLIYSRDGRVLHIDSMEKLARRSNAALKKQKGGGPIDADHKMYGGWFTMGGGSALGWAEEFEARPGKGLWSRSEWLPEGKELIGSRQYRYTSSVVSGEVEAEVDEEAWSVTWHIFPETVDGFAITNLPALQTTSMFSDDAAKDDRRRHELLLLTLKKLGLSADATKEQVRDRFLKFTAMSSDEGEPAEAAAEHLADSPPRNLEKPVQPIEGDPPPPLKKDGEDEGEDEGEGTSAGEEPAPPAAAPPPASAPAPATPQAPASGGEDPVTALAAARKRIKELETEAGVAFVTSLVHSGKLTPAQRPAALKSASTAEGLANLRELYEHAPQLLPVGNPAPTSTATPSDAPHGVDPLAHQLARQGVPAHEIAQQLKRRDQEKTR